MLVESMDEFDQYRAKAYIGSHQPLCYSSSLPSTPRSIHSRGYPRGSNDEEDMELDHLAALRISDNTPEMGDQVFVPIEENMATRILQGHHGSRSNTPLSGTPPPTFHTHHYRSHSCRTQAARRPRDLELTARSPIRRRTYSMPTKNRYRKSKAHQDEQSDGGHSSRHSSQGDENEDHDFIRVRTFSTSARGIINRGDSFKRRNQVPPVDPAVPPNNSPIPPGLPESEVRARTWSTTSQGSSVGSGGSSNLGTPPIHRVVVMGARGVGKTSIIQQFMTSEYMGNADSSVDDDENEPRSVSVLLDGHESTLQFIDQSPDEDNPDLIPVGDAYIIVYSVIDHESFDDAVDILHELRKQGLLQQNAVILVANKGDIVRLREVGDEDGKTMATRYDVKYIEVSAVLNHKIDDLLAGILQQIRLKEKRLNKIRKKAAASKKCLAGEGAVPSQHGSSGCLHLPAARGIMGKLFRRHPMFRSCDNLLVS